MKIENELIPFSSAQRVAGMQLSYSLFKNIINIFTSYTYLNRKDHELMQKTLDLVVERNRSLRIGIIKKNKEMHQFVREDITYKLNEITLNSIEEKEKFEQSIAKKGVKWKKGEILRAYHAHLFDGKDILYTQICHFATDMAGSLNFYKDFNAVYDALESNLELPPLPPKFEDIAKKDAKGHLDKEKEDAEEKYYVEYFKQFEKTPQYGGLNGKIHADGTPFKYSTEKPIPIALINSKTVSAQYNFDKELSDRVTEFCLQRKVTSGNFYYFLTTVTCAKLNDVERLMPIELINCRASLIDKSVVADKAQTIVSYIFITKNRSFIDLLTEFGNEQSKHMRHAGFDDMKLQYIMHKAWKYSMIKTFHPFMFSMVPSINNGDEGINLYSNGRFPLPAYLAFMFDNKTGELKIGYECQAKYVKKDDITRFHKELQNICRQVLDNPDILIKDIKYNL